MIITLLGRAFIRGSILAETGLHIGGGSGGLAIGGMDNPVVRDPLTNRPYIPGSSLRGKMRSLSERAQGLLHDYRISQVNIHACEEEESYRGCDFCHVFGVPAQSWSSQTRLLVRDVPLEEESARRLEEARTDLPFTEVKWEVAIDRVTSVATPRQMERVPAGAVFGPMEMSFAFYEPEDVRRFVLVIRAMQLLEEDYLGGQGSRGSGKVSFQGLSITCRVGESWDEIATWTPWEGATTFSLRELTEKPGLMAGLERWLLSRLHLA
ncbi:MAG: type III-A CRISPR-associated RAMP protein Csm3 [Sphingomonadaceae bacterium]